MDIFFYVKHSSCKKSRLCIPTCLGFFAFFSAIVIWHIWNSRICNHVQLIKAGTITERANVIKLIYLDFFTELFCKEISSYYV